MMELKIPSWKSFNKPTVWVSLFAIAALIPILATPVVSPTPLIREIRAVTILLCSLVIIRDYMISLMSGSLNMGGFLPKIVLSLYVVRLGPSILNDLYLQGKENPEIFVAIALSILALFAFNQMSSLLDRLLHSFDLDWNSQKKAAGEQENDPEITWMPKLCTSEDIHIASIHEAGHALVLAALPNLPDGFSMKALPQPDKGRLGSITSVDWSGILRPKDFLQVRLLCLLAGQQAEQFIFNEYFDGAQRDLRYWQKEAKEYLKSGLGGLYFAPIEDDYEAEQNRLTLERLKNEQNDLLQQFFKANHKVLQNLARELQAKGKLSKADVEPFLARVQFIDGFPKLS